MRRAIILIIMITIYYGCDIISTSSTKSLSTEFELTDTTGVVSREFQINESFDSYYRIINNTGEEQKYGYGYPQMYFEIIQNDSTVLTSVDGCVFPQPSFQSVLMPGDTLKGYWRGPQSICLENEITLQTGEYYLNVRSGYYFSEFGILHSDMIKFSIIK
jgi:hypothetical protein